MTARYRLPASKLPQTRAPQTRALETGILETRVLAGDLGLLVRRERDDCLIGHHQASRLG